MQNTTASKTDLRSYFKRKAEESKPASKKVKLASPEIIVSASENVNPAEIEIAKDEVKKSVRAEHYAIISENIRKEVGKYAMVNGTNAAIKKFAKLYPKFTFKRTAINTWKTKYQKNGNETVLKSIGRPNLLSDILLKKTKNIIIGTRLAGTVISRRMVMAIGTGVVKANDPSLLKEYGGHLQLTEDWARSLLISMDWVKRKGTTGKVEPSEKFLEEEKFTFQRAISQIVLEHDIPLDLVFNLDQTPLSYVSPGKYTFSSKGSTNVPIKGFDDKRQITATFVVSASGSFLPMQLIYKGKSERSLPKFTFLSSFHVTFTPNHWSNLEKCEELFKFIIFPYLRNKKLSLVTLKNNAH